MIRVDDWVTTDDLNLEPEALLAVKELSNTMVEAGPGAGKTELLSQKTNFLFNTRLCPEPKRILAVSFKKDAAANLLNRVVLRNKPEFSIRFTSKTFDSFAKSLFDRFRNGLPSEWYLSQDYTIDLTERSLKEICSQYGVHANRQEEMNNFKSEFFPLNGQEMSDRARSIWDGMLVGANGQSILTFSMINWLVIVLLKNNPKIVRAIQNTYSHVFVDEFQDTTTLQYELLKEYFFHSESTVTVVGDSHQKIMGWAGALDNAFEEFSNDFNPSRYILVFNRRSNKKIQNLLWHFNQTSVAPELPFENRGRLEAWSFSNDIEEAMEVAKQIKKLIDNGMPPNEICLLVKQTPYRYIDKLDEAFKVYGIRIRDEGNYQDLLKENISILILNVLKAAMRIDYAVSWQKIFELKMEFSGENLSVSNKQYERILRSAKSFINNVSAELHHVAVPDDLYTLFQNIINYFDVRMIQAKFIEYSDIRYLEQISEELNSCLFEYFLQEQNWEKAIRMISGEGIVPLMTIHKSKGLEFHTVFLIDLSDSSFWSYRDEPIEAKAALFVAISRAKENFFCTLSTTRHNRTQCKSLISEFYEVMMNSGLVDFIRFS